VAYLRLVLLLLLTHSYWCNRAEVPLSEAAPAGTSNTSSSTNSNTESSSDSSPTAAAAKSGSASQQQQRQQLADSLTDLWQQLGMGTASLAVFADALQADAELQVVMQATVDSHNSSSGGGGGSSGRTLFMPGDGPLMLRALGLIMHELHGVLLSTVNTVDCPDPQVTATLARHQQLTRQQQQLLQAVCLQLPQVLLRTALLCGAGEPMLTARAAAASIFAVTCWCAAWEMGEDLQLQQEQVLPGAFDCWLQLMQQVLLQQPHGGSSQPAAPPGSLLSASVDGSMAAVQVSSGAAQQQQPPAGLLLQVAATARVLPCSSTAGQHFLEAAICSCTPLKDPAGDRSPSCASEELSCVSLACDSLLAVEALLECLGMFKVRCARSSEGFM
jgi:hypothetical protein